MAEHPLCQIYMAEHGLDERAVLRGFAGLSRAHWVTIKTPSGRLWPAICFRYKGHLVPIAAELHHRAGREGSRYWDPRWFMAASAAWHREVHDHGAWARGRGYLLPGNMDPAGWMPGGTRCRTTDELLADRVAEAVRTPPVNF